MLIRYEVYFDESGNFRNDQQLSLVAGFAYCQKDQESIGLATKYQNIISKCIKSINTVLIRENMPFIDLTKDRNPIHTTIIHTDTEETKSIKQALREWLQKDAFRSILSQEDLLIVAAYGWPSDVRQEDFKLEGFYRHALLFLMKRITAQLRARHPEQRVDIQFFVPTRQVIISENDKEALDAFVSIGLTPNEVKNGFSINLGQAFLHIQEELDVGIACRQINYSLRADKDDKEMPGSSWGFYLADWICSWARNHLLAHRNSKMEEHLQYFSVGALQPIVISYSRSYYELQQAVTNIQDPLSYLRLFSEIASSQNQAKMWCAELMQKEHPYTDSRIFERTLQIICKRFNSPENPLYIEAEKYFQLLYQIVEKDKQVSSSIFAELCKNILICHQYTGASEAAKEFLERCLHSKREWSSIDVLSLIRIFSETYMNLLAYEEAEASLQWALENLTQNTWRNNNRWLANLPTAYDRAAFEKAQANLFLAMSSAYAERTDLDWLFIDAINLLSGLSLEWDANIARFHYIHYLLQKNRTDELANQLNFYFCHAEETRDLTAIDTWKTWLVALLHDGNGEADRIRFPLWIYQKALYSCWESITDDNKVEIMMLLFDDAETVNAIEQALWIDHHPVEELVIYRGLLGTQWSSAYAAKAVKRLEQLIEKSEAIVRLICRIGIIRIRINANIWGATSITDPHFCAIKRGIRSDVLTIYEQWQSIKPENASDSRIDVLKQLVDDKSQWAKMNAGKISNLLSYEFY